MEQKFRRIVEAEAQNEHLHVEAFWMEHSKKHGVIGYSEDAVFLMEFDSAEDIKDLYGTDDEIYSKFETANKGEIFTDDASGSYYMKLW